MRKKHGNHGAGTAVLAEVKKYLRFPNRQAVFWFTNLNGISILAPPNT